MKIIKKEGERRWKHSVTKDLRFTLLTIGLIREDWLKAPTLLAVKGGVVVEDTDIMVILINCVSPIVITIHKSVVGTKT